MKKTILILLTALLAIGTMQADELTRYMVIQKTNGQTVKIKTADVENVTFEEIAGPVTPTTVAEAEAMLVGYWETPFNLFAEFDRMVLIIDENLDILACYRISDSATEEMFKPYVGQYVLMGELGQIVVNSENPTTATITDGSDEVNYPVSDIVLDSFHAVIQGLDFNFERIEPFEYVVLPY